MRWLNRLALQIAVRLVMFVERQMKTKCGQLALDDARLEVQMCLNAYFR